MISIAYESIWAGSGTGVGYVNNEDNPDLKINYNLGFFTWSNDTQHFTVPLSRAYEIVEDK